jgi:hypothetical protein
MHPKLATCAVLIASCALTTIFAKPAAAKIVYTPVNTTLTGGGHIKIDLNHDGVKDFDIQAAVSLVACGFGHGLHGVVTITPTTGDGVIASGTQAAALVSGISVGPTGTFSNSPSLMTNFFFSRGCGSSYLYGNWCHRSAAYGCSGTGYLGLRFLFNGQTHYGWAYVTVTGGLFNGPALSVTLKSFAYETIAGRSITTGQTSGV